MNKLKIEKKEAVIAALVQVARLYDPFIRPKQEAGFKRVSKGYRRSATAVAGHQRKLPHSGAVEN